MPPKMRFSRGHSRPSRSAPEDDYRIEAIVSQPLGSRHCTYARSFASRGWTTSPSSAHSHPLELQHDATSGTLGSGAATAVSTRSRSHRPGRTTTVPPSVAVEILHIDYDSDMDHDDAEDDEGGGSTDVHVDATRKRTRDATVPSVEVCMACHKGKDGCFPDEAMSEVMSKIRKAAVSIQTESSTAASALSPLTTQVFGHEHPGNVRGMGLGARKEDIATIVGQDMEEVKMMQLIEENIPLRAQVTALAESQTTLAESQTGLAESQTALVESQTVLAKRLEQLKKLIFDHIGSGDGGSGGGDSCVQGFG